MSSSVEKRENQSIVIQLFGTFKYKMMLVHSNVSLEFFIKGAELSLMWVNWVNLGNLINH